MSRPYKLPSGKWLIQWMDPVAGKRRSATFELHGDALDKLAEEEDKARKARREIKSGRAEPAQLMTLADAAADWLLTRPPGRRKADNALHLRLHILPAMIPQPGNAAPKPLGEMRLGDITAKVVEKFIRGLEAKRTARKGEVNATGRALSKATIRSVLNTLGKFMRDATGTEWLRVKYAVPTSGYGWIREAGQVAAFLVACGDGWFRMAAELAVYAGLRKGEVAGLRRDALDFERELMRIDRSYDGPTKSKHVRWVPLAPALALRLKAWLLAHPGPYVVTTEDGARIGERTETAKKTRRACKRAGVPPVTFHQLRHTAASHLAQRVSLPMMGAIMGHANPATTARYAHLDTEGIARSARVQLDFTAPAGQLATLAVNKLQTAPGAGK